MVFEWKIASRLGLTIIKQTRDMPENIFKIKKNIKPSLEVSIFLPQRYFVVRSIPFHIKKKAITSQLSDIFLQEKRKFAVPLSLVFDAVELKSERERDRSLKTQR